MDNCKHFGWDNERGYCLDCGAAGDTLLNAIDRLEAKCAHYRASLRRVVDMGDSGTYKLRAIADFADRALQQQGQTPSVDPSVSTTGDSSGQEPAATNSREE